MLLIECTTNQIINIPCGIFFNKFGCFGTQCTLRITEQQLLKASSSSQRIQYSIHTHVLKSALENCADPQILIFRVSPPWIASQFSLELESSSLSCMMVVVDKPQLVYNFEHHFHYINVARSHFQILFCQRAGKKP